MYALLANAHTWLGDKTMSFTLDMKLKDIMEANPKTAEAMQELGLHCLGCAFSVNETLANAAQMHNIDPTMLLEKVNSAEQGKLSEEAAAKAQPARGILQMDKKTYSIAPIFQQVSSLRKFYERLLMCLKNTMLKPLR